MQAACTGVQALCLRNSVCQKCRMSWVREQSHIRPVPALSSKRSVEMSGLPFSRQQLEHSLASCSSCLILFPRAFSCISRNTKLRYMVLAHDLQHLLVWPSFTTTLSSDFLQESRANLQTSRSYLDRVIKVCCNSRILVPGLWCTCKHAMSQLRDAQLHLPYKALFH